MKRSLTAFFCLVICWSLAPVHAQQPSGKKKKQFLYTLKVVPRLVKAEGWTDADNKIVAQHAQRLQRLLTNGQLILAGRTLNEDEEAIGIVILEVESEAEARRLMESDPAVKAGIMQAQLFPYFIALMRGSGTN